MKKLVFLLSVVCLFAFSAFAQTNPNFAGEWVLDKSKLDERRAAAIESQTMTVEQNDKEIKATTATKRIAPPAGAAGGQGGGGGRAMGGGDMTMTYSLDGKEVTFERETPNGKIPTKTTAKFDGGKLHISSSTTFTGQDGQERSNSSKTTWELSADGKTLTVRSTRSTPNGDVTIESFYTKKS
jgi:hypothetical protein